MIPNPIIHSKPMRNAVTKMSELLECPHCGCMGINLAFPRVIDGKMAAVVECFTDNCGAKITADTPEEATTAWNARATPAPEPQPEVAAEPVAWRIRDEGDRDWMALVFDDPRFDVALAAVPGLVAEPLYAGSPPVVEEAVKAEWEALRQIEIEAKFANNVISHNRDGQGQGRVKVATSMHRIEKMATAAIARSATP